MAMKKHVAAAASLAILGVSGLSMPTAFAQDNATVDVVIPADAERTLNLVPSANDGVQAIVTNGDSIDSVAALVRGNDTKIGSLSEIIEHAGTDVLGSLPTDIQNAVNSGNAQDAIQSIQSQLQNLSPNNDILNSLSDLIQSLSNTLSSGDGSSNLSSGSSDLTSGSSNLSSGSSNLSSGSSNTTPTNTTTKPTVTSDAIQDALDNMNNNTTVNDSPDFATANNDGSMNVDTAGVKPGKYDINGTVAIPGQDKPVEFTATITVPDSGQTSSGSASSPNDESAPAVNGTLTEATTQPGNLPNNRVDAVANQPSASGITVKDVEDRLNDTTNNGTVNDQSATTTGQVAPASNAGGQQAAPANTQQQDQPQQSASGSSQQYQQPGQPSVSNTAQPATAQSMPVTGANVKPLAVIALLTAAGAVGAIMYGRRRMA